jgi:hypothetical protein
MNDEFGPACVTCGHPARFHNASRCKFVPDGGLTTCDCRGYKPGEIARTSNDDELIQALLTVRSSLSSLEFAAPEMWGLHLDRINKALRKVGI